MSERDYERLDLWLWHARVCRHRQDCAALIEKGAVRINRQVTRKPHSKIRTGDVLGLPGRQRDEVRIWRVTALASRRGSATEAALLYEVITENQGES
ncbi:RNA-binding S4 domain-containing protein [Asaia siamensis]|uniref:RNA-binding protein S4 n=1 Tax=Asaia siamensis TaxID=110479 RepID=A0ABQ1LG37_9PROT|nr:S4 domain-containing protein [Asaia siamensis]GBR08244.1 heat shock protein [Asaia siamensis NRIC 0323]GGC23215.1 RNA-binding protein S4 [Asaia siamensis]